MSSPSVVPAFDVTVYLVLNDYGKLGRAYVETEEGKTDLDTVVENIVAGQYSNPLRVVAFNTAEGWAHDVSEDIAREVAARALSRERELPEAVQRFVWRHTREELPVAGR